MSFYIFYIPILSIIYTNQTHYKISSKLLKSSFMYVTYCKLCPLSSIIIENVLDVYKHLQVMSFNPNSINFYG
ncbi:hypothetical protein Hanom_Chr12g01085221 [Helianthus anomalus]